MTMTMTLPVIMMMKITKGAMRTRAMIMMTMIIAETTMMAGTMMIITQRKMMTISTT
jgi:hypothetical protein